MRNFQARQQRLTTLAGLLSNGDIWTSESLAKRVGVSLRTVTRDIDVLRQQGYDIETERGAGGGICLMGYARPPTFILSDEEVLNTLMALAMTESLQCPILGSQLNTARSKLSLFLNEKQRKRITQLRERVLIGDVASADVSATVDHHPSAFSDQINQAFVQQAKLTIRYIAESGSESIRTIEPQFILLNWPAWYLLGWDSLRDAPRMFRVDRIQAATIEAQTFRLRSSRTLLSGFEQFFTAM